MKKNFKQLFTLCAFIVLAASFSSCNRGYGCPTNFSVNDSVETVVKAVVTTATTLFTNH